jgi:hypothetical protein
MVQWSHHRAQQIVSLAPGISRLLRRHLVVELVTNPTASPLVPHSGGKPRSTSKTSRVKRNTAKLGGESSIAYCKMNFLILVV